jgi:hypothetical protein
MDDDHKIKKSLLCQSVTRDGKTVHIDIYEDGESGWILEIVDGNNSSTTWNESFETEMSALNEALSAIEKEGIDAFIGRDTDYYMDIIPE